MLELLNGAAAQFRHQFRRIPGEVMPQNLHNAAWVLQGRIARRLIAVSRFGHIGPRSIVRSHPAHETKTVDPLVILLYYLLDRIAFLAGRSLVAPVTLRGIVLVTLRIVAAEETA